MRSPASAQSVEPLPMRAPAADDSVDFSLFENDGLRRVYRRLGVGPNARFRLVKRCVLAVALTWIPVALLAWAEGFVGTSISPTNFLADFAAYAQFVVGLPLFVLAEAIVDASTRDAAQQFLSCGIVRADDRRRALAIHDAIAQARTWRSPDIACVAIAYALSFAILVPEFRPDALPTWHVEVGHRYRHLTVPGAWEFFVALPILNYVWLRFAWKIALWIWYLYRITRMRLEIHATHADRTGGIGFISEAQGRFAVLILAYGISNVAATVGYEIAVQGYDLTVMPVWGPLVGFAIGAPLLFTLPLFMFTKQLYRAKRHALAVYRERVTEHSRRVEAHWATAPHAAPADEELRELAELATLAAMFSRIEQMRVVPFDLRSFGQLVGSTLGALATLLPLLHVKGDLAAIFDAIGKLLGHLSGG